MLEFIFLVNQYLLAIAPNIIDICDLCLKFFNSKGCSFSELSQALPLVIKMNKIYISKAKKLFNA